MEQYILLTVPFPKWSNSSMFTLILLCKVDDAINIRLEETIVMSFRLSVHSQNALLSSSLLSLRVCATMNRTGVAAFNQMVSIIGLFVSILYRSFGVFFRSTYHSVCYFPGLTFHLSPHLTSALYTRSVEVKSISGIDILSPYVYICFVC